MTFQELGIAEPILRAIDELGFAAPMPVQETVIPYLLGERNDVIALAQTGTGKTAAYGIPLIQRTDPKKDYPQAVVICPTRELCLQIAGDMNDFAKYVDGLKIVPVYGGASIDSQIRALKRGAQIIVATPGRLIDLMERKAARMDRVENVVLDEADEMLNMGFSESIDAILAGVPSERNTLLFSATMSKEIGKIAKNYLTNAKEIVVGSRNEGAELVNHEYYLVHARDKYPALKRIVDFYPRIYAIIFCRTRVETQEIADKLIQDGYSAEALHGDLSQAQRDLTMQKFRQHHTQLLIATDVAARGLDVDDLTHVINYGLPDDVENYTHRSGRTGRAGKKGTSICIIHLREKSKVRAIEKTIGKDFVKKSLPTANEICTKQLYKVIDQMERVQVEEERIEPFLPEIYRKLEWMDKEDIIKRFVSMEFGRFLDYYAHAPEIEEPQQMASTRDRSSQGRHESKGGRGEAEKGYVRFFFGAGKRDHFFAREIIGTLNRYTKEQVNVGKIDLMTNFSFFEVPTGEADIVEAALKNVIDKNGRRISVERTDKAQGGGSHGDSRRSSRSSNGGGRGSYGESKYAHKDSKRSYDRDKSGYTKEGRSGRRTKPAAQDSSKAKHQDNDWRQFFGGDNRELKGEKPDFSEDGWVKRKGGKKK